MKQLSYIKWPIWAGFALGIVMLSSWTLPELVMPSYFYEVSEAGDTSKPGKRSSFHNRDYNQEDLDHAMISIDKAMIDLDKNMKVDFAKMEKELKAAIEKVQHIDIEKINKEIQASLKQIDADKISKEVSESLSKARLGIEKAKQELTELKAFTNELQKDGLIDKKKGYKIEIRNKKLFINGKEQPKEVNEKYRKYLDKEDFSITSDIQGSTSI